MKLVAAVLVIALLGGRVAKASNDPCTGCGPIMAGSPLPIVQLRHEMPEPYFYLRPPDSDYVILVAPDTLINAFSRYSVPVNAFSRYSIPANASPLLKALQRDIPLTANTDLWEYLEDDQDNKDWGSFYQIQYLLFELLNEGESAVLDSINGILEPNVAVEVDFEEDGSDDRYCEVRRIYVAEELLWYWHECTVN